MSSSISQSDAPRAPFRWLTPALTQRVSAMLHADAVLAIVTTLLGAFLTVQPTASSVATCIAAMKKFGKHLDESAECPVAHCLSSIIMKPHQAVVYVVNAYFGTFEKLVGDDAELQCSLQELAAGLGGSCQCIMNWETGTKKPFFLFDSLPAFPAPPLLNAYLPRYLQNPCVRPKDQTYAQMLSASTTPKRWWRELTVSFSSPFNGFRPADKRSDTGMAAVYNQYSALVATTLFVATLLTFPMLSFAPAMWLSICAYHDIKSWILTYASNTVFGRCLKRIPDAAYYAVTLLGIGVGYVVCRQVSNVNRNKPRNQSKDDKTSMVRFQGALYVLTAAVAALSAFVASNANALKIFSMYSGTAKLASCVSGLFGSGGCNQINCPAHDTASTSRCVTCAIKKAQELTMAYVPDNSFAMRKPIMAARALVINLYEQRMKDEKAILAVPLWYPAFSAPVRSYIEEILAVDLQQPLFINVLFQPLRAQVVHQACAKKKGLCRCHPSFGVEDNLYRPLCRDPAQPSSPLAAPIPIPREPHPELSHGGIGFHANQNVNSAQAAANTVSKSEIDLDAFEPDPETEAELDLEEVMDSLDVHPDNRAYTAEKLRLAKQEIANMPPSPPGPACYSPSEILVTDKMLDTNTVPGCNVFNGPDSGSNYPQNHHRVQAQAQINDQGYPDFKFHIPEGMQRVIDRHNQEKKKQYSHIIAYTRTITDWLAAHQTCCIWFSVLVGILLAVACTAIAFVYTKQKKTTDERCGYFTTKQACAYADCPDCVPPVEEARKVLKRPAESDNVPNPADIDEGKGNLGRHRGATTRVRGDGETEAQKAERRAKEYTEIQAIRHSNPKSLRVKRNYVIYGFLKPENLASCFGSTVCMRPPGEQFHYEEIPHQHVRSHLDDGWHIVVKSEECHNGKFTKAGVFTVYYNNGAGADAAYTLQNLAKEYRGLAFDGVRTDAGRKTTLQQDENLIDSIKSGDIGPAEKIVDFLEHVPGHSKPVFPFDVCAKIRDYCGLKKSTWYTQVQERPTTSTSDRGPASIAQDVRSSPQTTPYSELINYVRTHPKDAMRDESALAGQPPTPRIYPPQNLVFAIESKINDVWEFAGGSHATQVGIATRTHVPDGRVIRFVPCGLGAEPFEPPPNSIVKYDGDLSMCYLSAQQLRAIFPEGIGKQRCTAPVLGEPCYGQLVVKVGDHYESRDSQGVVGPVHEIEVKGQKFTTVGHTIFTTGGYSGMVIYNHNGHIIGDHKAGTGRGGINNYMIPATNNVQVIYNSTREQVASTRKVLDAAAQSLNC